MTANSTVKMKVTSTVLVVGLLLAVSDALPVKETTELDVQVLPFVLLVLFFWL